jgi:hypothetical protein
MKRVKNQKPKTSNEGFNEMVGGWYVAGTSSTTYLIPDSMIIA